jgi:hypothetical protein
MQGLNAISGGGAAALRMQAEYQVRTARMAQEALKMQGEAAVRLIAAATLEPGVGEQLNLTA